MCTCVDWAAVGAIVSAIMTVATFCTLYFSRKQLNEMRRQWEDDHRPHLIISIISTEDHFLFKIENVGRVLARNIRFKFCSFLKESSISQSSCDYFRSIEETVYHISPGTSKHFLILPTYGFAHLNYPETGESITEEQLREWVAANQDESLIVSCTYTGSNGNTQYLEVFNTQIKNLYNKSVRVIEDEVGALLAINSSLTAALRYYKGRERDKRFGF